MVMKMQMISYLFTMQIVCVTIRLSTVEYQPSVFEHCWVFDGHTYDIVEDKAVSYFIAILISVIAEGNKLSDLKVVDKLDTVVCNPEIPSWDYNLLSSLQGFANRKVQ